MTATNTVSAPRADARRNRARVIDAALATLRLDPHASMARVASNAGVGRATLYGHFSSRAELVDAALQDVLARGDATLAELGLDGPPQLALEALVTASWELLDESRALLVAAQQELPPERIRELHAPLEGRVVDLIGRGRRDGSFRTDVPASWHVATMHALLQAAAGEITAGRLAPKDAPALLTRTLLAALRA